MLTRKDLFNYNKTAASLNLARTAHRELALSIEGEGGLILKENIKDMAQYINKAAVITEIEKIYNDDYKFLPSDLVESVQDFKDDLLIALDTLEVKEVDLEKEIEKYLLTNATFLIGGDSKLVIHHIAKHFFELGLKIQKGE